MKNMKWADGFNSFPVDLNQINPIPNWKLFRPLNNSFNTDTDE